MKPLALLFSVCVMYASILFAAPPLKVGMELAYPPFEMSTKDGVPSGVSVDLAYALGKALGREVSIENIAWDGLIPSLKTGKIDVIISSMTITQERAKSVAFSIPYAQSNLAILTHPSTQIKSIEDLNQKGKTVAVKKGTTGHIYAMKYLSNTNVLVFDKENAAVLEVIQKKVDGFLYDQLTIYQNHIKHAEKTIALLKPFQSEPESWGIAMRKSDVELKKAVDAFITKAKSDGTFDALSKKHLAAARATFDALGIPFFF